MDGVDDNLNQPDPLGEENNNPSFEAKDIRRSFAGTTKSIFSDVVTITKKSPKVTMVLVAVFAALIVAVITLVILSSTSPHSPETTPSSESQSGQPSQNSSSTLSAEEASLRSAEKEKLSTVMALISQEDWEYANALLGTISPKNLSDCNKLYYYRSIIEISAHFKGSNLPVDVAAVNVEKLKDACLVTNE